jgi:hypothetical protein
MGYPVILPACPSCYEGKSGVVLSLIGIRSECCYGQDCHVWPGLFARTGVLSLSHWCNSRWQKQYNHQRRENLRSLFQVRDGVVFAPRRYGSQIQKFHIYLLRPLRHQKHIYNLTTLNSYNRKINIFAIVNINPVVVDTLAGEKERHWDIILLRFNLSFLQNLIARELIEVGIFLGFIPGWHRRFAFEHLEIIFRFREIRLRDIFSGYGFLGHFFRHRRQQTQEYPWLSNTIETIK